MAVLLISAACLALAVMYIAGPIGAHVGGTFNPTLEITAISDSTPGANADITFRTALPAGDHILGNWSVDAPAGWGIANHSAQLDGKVTAVGTMTARVVLAPPPQDCASASLATYGPFNLLDEDPGAGQGAPDSRWTGRITDFADGNPGTFWNLLVDRTGSVFSAIMTNALGVTICTEEVFTLTMCGKANPSATATVCGTDRVVMTNPGTAGAYVWTSDLRDETTQHNAQPSACVAIGAASCPTPTPTATPTATATPTPTATPTACPDTDGDGWTDCQEAFITTDPQVACLNNGWPPDADSTGSVDISDVFFASSRFGSTSGQPGYSPRAEIGSQDGTTGIDDIFAFSSRFSLTCP